MLSGTTKLRLRTIVAPHGGCAETCEQFMRKTLSRLHARLFEREVTMPRSHATSSTASASGAITLVTLLIMIMAAASGTLASRSPAATASGTAPIMADVQSWDHAQVRELIIAIEHSRKDGFDPENYGLAALRSELEQSLAIWGSPHPRQLSVLAQTAALALANDYRRLGGRQTANAADLHAALLRGSLSQWITAGARQTKQFF